MLKVPNKFPNTAHTQQGLIGHCNAPAESRDVVGGNLESWSSLNLLPMEGNGDEPETINVWDLMKGLDDDEKSPRAKHFTTAPLPKQKVMASAKPLDSFMLEPSDVQEIPRWLSHSGLGKSASPSNGLIGARSRGGSIGGSSSHISDLFGDKLSVSSHNTLAEHLQRSLSFEPSPKNEMKSILGQKDAFDTRQGKGLKMTDSSSWLLNESDAATSPSGPPSLGTVNQKWLQDDSRTSKQRQDLRAACKASGNETQSKLPSQQVSPHLLHATTKLPGATMKTTVGSYNMHDYANRDGGADPGYPTPPSVGQNKIGEVPQGGRVRRYRHSFTGGNRDQQFTEDRSSIFVNRPSSWELEKVVVDPKLKVVLYSTSSQADVHAYEDSNAVRAILISLVGASFDEKSISQHPEFEQELKNALNTPTALVPTVCVRGRYIAGVDNIIQLYKKGVLGSLLVEKVAHGLKPNTPCICRGGKFLICPVCKGKRKLARQGEDAVLCRHCSGTGLIKCPSCLNS